MVTSVHIIALLVGWCWAVAGCRQKKDLMLLLRCWLMWTWTKTLSSLGSLVVLLWVRSSSVYTMWYYVID